MVSTFGLPANYTSNPLYMQYMYNLMQNAMQQQALFAQQNAVTQAQQAQQQATSQVNIPDHQLTVDQTNINTTQKEAKNVHPKDLVDDGKISGKKKFKNFMKGVGKFFTGMVCDENGKFSLKRTLTTIAVGGAAIGLCVATGGAATPFLVAAGATLGAVQTGKGIYKAATAKTDAEAEMAWQTIGSGTTAVVTSVAGAKGALKAAGKAPVATSSNPVPVTHQIGNAASNGIWSKISGATSNAMKATKDALVATKDCFKISGEGLYSGAKALAHPIQAAGKVRAYWNNTMYPNLKNAYSAENGFKLYTEKATKDINKNIKDIETQINKLNQEAAQSTSNTRMTEISSEIQSLKAKLYAERYKLENITKQTQYDLKTQQKMWQKLRSELKKHNPEEIITDGNGNSIKIKDIIQINDEILNAIKSKDLRGINLRDKLERLNISKQQLEAMKKAGADIPHEELIQNTINNGLKATERALRSYTYAPVAKATLKTSGLAAGSLYLATRDKTPSSQLSQDDLYAQSLGFANAQEMQDYLNALEAQNNTTATQNGTTTQQNVNQSQYNQYPYAYNYTNMQAPMGNYLGFNDLYVSPFPEYI